MTENTNANRRRLLRGALTASAAAAAFVVGGHEAWARPEFKHVPNLKLRRAPRLRARPFNFNHSRFRGRGARLGRFNDVNQLINQIARRTHLPAVQVHAVLTMAFPSMEQFILRQYAAHPQALNRQLKLANRGAQLANLVAV